MKKKIRKSFPFAIFYSILRSNCVRKICGFPTRISLKKNNWTSAMVSDVANCSPTNKDMRRLHVRVQSRKQKVDLIPFLTNRKMEHKVIKEVNFFLVVPREQKRKTKVIERVYQPSLWAYDRRIGWWDGGSSWSTGSGAHVGSLTTCAWVTSAAFAIPSTASPLTSRLITRRR